MADTAEQRREFAAMMKRLGVPEPEGGWSQKPMVNKPRRAEKVPPKKVPLWKQREDKYNAMSTKDLEAEYKGIMDSRNDPKGIPLRTDLRPTTIRGILDKRKKNVVAKPVSKRKKGGKVWSGNDFVREANNYKEI